MDVKTTDGFYLRVFCIGFTKRQPNQIKKTTYAKTSQCRSIRKKMVEIMTREISQIDLKETVNKLWVGRGKIWAMTWLGDDLYLKLHLLLATFTVLCYTVAITLTWVMGCCKYHKSGNFHCKTHIFNGSLWKGMFAVNVCSTRLFYKKKYENLRYTIFPLIGCRIPDSIGKDIEKKCQSIYPLHDVFIRKVKVLKKPKFDSKLRALILQQISVIWYNISLSCFWCVNYFNYSQSTHL